MTYENIRIAIGNGGVTRVIALGKTGEDRSEALAFLTKITLELDRIDQQAKEKLSTE
jgi:hypothetical protein